MNTGQACKEIRSENCAAEADESVPREYNTLNSIAKRKDDRLMSKVYQQGMSAKKGEGRNTLFEHEFREFSFN